MTQVLREFGGFQGSETPIEYGRSLKRIAELSSMHISKKLVLNIHKNAIAHFKKTGTSFFICATSNNIKNCKRLTQRIAKLLARAFGTHVWF